MLVGAGALTGLGLMPQIASSKPMPKKLIKPKKLTQGDTIWIVAPSGASTGQENIDSAIQKVSSLGYKVKLGKNVSSRSGYLAGTDEERSADVNEALRCTESRGIIFLRGGYGAMRILPQLDYAALRKNPKITMGFSDITALHMAFLTQAGVVSFHGPCAESSWSPFSRSTIGMITEAKPFGITMHPNEPATMVRKCLVSGVAEGKIVAGNLSMIVSLIGTKYMPSLAGCILCLEDIGEDPYRVDRMLTQIWLSGIMKEARGLVFGNFRERKPANLIPDPESLDPTKTFDIDQVCQDRASKIGLPCYQGLSFGHIALNHILPQGILAKLDTNAMSLEILDSAVIE